MEFFTILLSGVLGLVAPAGLVVDRTAENAIRSQLQQAERLEVRVDNAPSYQLVQGKVARVRVAGRGLRLKQQNVRIAALELETDSIDLDPRSLGKQKLKLRRSLQAGVHFLLEQQDLNQVLPTLVARIQEFVVPELGGDRAESDSNSDSNYRFINPRLELLANNRLRFQVELAAEGDDEPLAIVAESGLAVMGGRQLNLVQPTVTVDREAVAQNIVDEIATNLSQELDFRRLEAYGLQVRILQLKVEPQKLDFVTFVRVEPSSPLLQNSKVAEF
jgi:LmeA-like phospholipid-binding